MGISVTYRGRIDPSAFTDFPEVLLSLAKDRGVGAFPHSQTVVKGYLQGRALEPQDVSGLLLVPHFATDPLPFLPLRSGILVDTLVDEREGALHFSDEVVISTQFGGPEAHREVVGLLEALRDAVAPGLSIEDETGWAGHRDDARLEMAFAEEWQRIAQDLRESIATAPWVDVGGFLVVPGEVGTQIEDSDRAFAPMLEELRGEFESTYGPPEVGFPRSVQGLEALEDLFDDADDEELASMPEHPRVQTLVHGAGLVFGEILQATLGGIFRSVSSEDRALLDSEASEPTQAGEHLMLVDVGGVGLRVDPFEAAAERLLHGPCAGFVQQYEVVRRIVAALRSASA